MNIEQRSQGPSLIVLGSVFVGLRFAGPSHEGLDFLKRFRLGSVASTLGDCLTCRTRQNNADLSIFAGLGVNLDSPRMLFDNDVVSN